MSTRIKLMTFLLGSACILAFQAVRATPAAAEPGTGCFHCDGGYVTEDGWQAHQDYYIFFNAKHGGIHSGLALGPCEVHPTYQRPN